MRFISELISTDEEGRLSKQKVDHLDQKDLCPQQSLMALKVSFSGVWKFANFKLNLHLRKEGTQLWTNFLKNEFEKDKKMKLVRIELVKQKCYLNILSSGREEDWFKKKKKNLITINQTLNLHQYLISDNITKDFCLEHLLGLKLTLLSPMECIYSCHCKQCNGLFSLQKISNSHCQGLL